MVLNQGKYNFLLLGRNNENEKFVFKNKIMRTGEKQKILEIINDEKIINS